MGRNLLLKLQIVIPPNKQLKRKRGRKSVVEKSRFIVKVLLEAESKYVKNKKKESPYIVIETDSTEGNSEHLKTYIFSNPFRETAELRCWTCELLLWIHIF